MTQPDLSNDVETAVTAVYRGPLEEFVSRRDALVKQFRSAKQRDAADRIKSLRKPSRMAWLLDAIVHEDPASIDQLAAAIDAAQTGDDARSAFENVKTAVRNVAAVGARAAVRAEQPVEPSAIVAAVHAVIGHSSAFAEFRAGRLVDVPDAGGLDMLAAVTVREPVAKAESPPPAPADAKPTKPDVRPAAAVPDPALVEAARATLHRAEAARAEANKRAEQAVRAVRNAQQRLDAAERTLQLAQAEVQSRHADLERTRTDAEMASTELEDADRAVAEASAHIAKVAEG